MKQRRLIGFLLISVLAHVALLLLIKAPQPDTAPVGETTFDVRLTPEPTPVPIVPSEQIAAPALPPVSSPPIQPEIRPAASSEPVSTRPVPEEPAPAPGAQQTVDANQILGQLSRYRIPGDTTSARLLPPDDAPPPLLARQFFEHEVMDQALPALPFEDPEGPFRFYSVGIRGDVERAFDSVTKEFGWTTRYGTKVKCAYVLVIVSCGWK